MVQAKNRVRPDASSEIDLKKIYFQLRTFEKDKDIGLMSIGEILEPMKHTRRRGG